MLKEMTIDSCVSTNGGAIRISKGDFSSNGLTLSSVVLGSTDLTKNGLETTVSSISTTIGTNGVSIAKTLSNIVW